MTEITQPAILTASVAAWRVWHEKGVDPSFVAGHSLGEYSAHVAAGTMSFADAVCTVRNRGKYMQEAVPVGVGAMATILGMDVEKVAALCTAARASQHQFVRADRNLRSYGGDRAGHEDSQRAWCHACNYAAGRPPLFIDGAGPGSAGCGFAVSYPSKVMGSVKWDQSMRWLITKGIQVFVEVSPGKVLCGLMRQSDRTQTCLKVDTSLN
jgi:[acyl-carrier-protein] S-malonyltransferase